MLICFVLNVVNVLIGSMKCMLMLCGVSLCLCSVLYSWYCEMLLCVDDMMMVCFFRLVMV